MVRRTGLPSSPSTSTVKASVYLRPSWKMWPISMPRADDQRPGAVGRRIAVAHLGGLDGAVGGEVAARDQVDDVLAGLVGAGDPRRAVHHPRVDQVANSVGQQRFRPDVALDQERVLGEVGVVEQRVLGRVERGVQALLVDLAVAGHARRQQLPLATRLTHLEQRRSSACRRR